MSDLDTNLFTATRDCINITQPFQKVAATRRLYQRWCRGELETTSRTRPEPIPEPGRPEQPRLVNPHKVPKRGFKSRQGLVRLAHAIAHIEFNAINLALDAVYRFREMPDDFVSDWLRVAAEESSHFEMLTDYLEANGSFYGAYDAHNGLWEMALKTDHDVMVRMALVPRVLEARGLDVTPGMIRKLRNIDEHGLVQVLELIHTEEIGHVMIGTRWFSYACQQRGLVPSVAFVGLVKEYMNGNVQGPFDRVSRIRAGFTEDELQELVTMSMSRERRL